MTRTIDIPHGKRYIIERCPYCGRRLAEWYEGTTVVNVLHPKAAITYIAKDALGLLPPKAYPLEGSSRCLRILCRIRSRLERTHETPEVSP